MKEELLGLSVILDEVVVCGDCGAELANIVVSETNTQRQARGLKPLRSKFKIINCHKCGGKSFDTKIYEGTTSISPPLKQNISLSDIDTDILNYKKEDETIYSILEVIK